MCNRKPPGLTEQPAPVQPTCIGCLIPERAGLKAPGSIMVGGTIERLQTRFDLGTYWTEADSRRAMARLSGFGGGMMAGAALLGSILG